MSVVGERIRAAVEKLPINFEGNPIHVTVSIGLAQSPVFGDESEFARNLFAAADVAMYRAKKSGRNQFSVEPFPAAGPQDSVPEGIATSGRPHLSLSR